MGKYKLVWAVSLTIFFTSLFDVSLSVAAVAADDAMICDELPTKLVRKIKAYSQKTSVRPLTLKTARKWAGKRKTTPCATKPHIPNKVKARPVEKLPLPSVASEPSTPTAAIPSVVSGVEPTLSPPLAALPRQTDPALGTAAPLPVVSPPHVPSGGSRGGGGYPLLQAPPIVLTQIVYVDRATTIFQAPDLTKVWAPTYPEHFSPPTPSLTTVPLPTTALLFLTGLVLLRKRYGHNAQRV